MQSSLHHRAMRLGWILAISALLAACQTASTARWNELLVPQPEGPQTVEEVAAAGPAYYPEIDLARLPAMPVGEPEFLERAGLPDFAEAYALEDDYEVRKLLAATQPVWDEASMRLSYFMAQRAYPRTTLPQGARVAALQQTLEMLPVEAAAAQPLWENIGPAPMRNSDIGQQFIDVSGRIRALVVDPRNSDVVYLGAAQGGVWKTINGGESWTPLTDNQVSLAIGALALDPSNPDVVYAGTGEPTHGGDNYYGAGILKSTDAGQTWSRLGADVFTGAAIARLVVDPQNPAVVYAASSLSGVAGPGQPLRGIFKSNDGGQSWVGLLTCPDCFGASDLALDPQNPTTLYAAFWGFGVFKSTNSGANWERVLVFDPQQQEARRILLSLSPAQPQTLYASVHLVVPQQYDGAYLVKTVNGGATWNEVSLGGYNFCGNQCWYSHVIAVHPTNPDTLYLGGMAQYLGQTDEDFTIRRVIVRTTNSGATYEDLTPNDSPERTLHPDMHAITFDPQDPNVIWVGNDGGVWKSTDGGQTWQNKNTNLATLQFTGIAIDPNNANILQGGMQDNNKAYTTDGGATRVWVAADVGDGGFAGIDPFVSQIFYGTRFGKSFQRNDQGAGFTGTWPIKVDGIGQTDRSLFYAPFAIDPVQEGVLYFGTFRLYRTENRGESWTPISDGLTKGEGSLSTIAVAPSNPQVIYTGASDGSIQMTADGGATWSNLTKAPLPNRFVSEIVVSPENAQVAYAVFNGFNTHTPEAAGHVFKTVNGGGDWQDISGNLPDVPVLSILLDRQRSGTLYIGTDTGVFQTTNDGQSWTPYNNGLPNVAVVDLALSGDGRFLIAATHGRSIYRLALSAAPPVTPVTGPYFVYLSNVAREGRVAPPTATPTNTPLPTNTPVPPEGTQLPTGTPTPTPTATSTPTATPSPTEPPLTPGAATATPTATATPSPTPATGAFHDDFSDPDSGWASLALTTCEFGYAGGRYQIDVFAFGEVCLASAPVPMVEDGTIQVTAARQNASDGSIYGLLFGLDSAASPTQFHVFWVNPTERAYTIQKYENGSYTPQPAIWVGSTAINPGAAANVLKVRRKGAEIRVYANGVLLDQVNDNAFSANNQVGVVNWSAYGEGAASTNFDDFSIDHFTVVYAEAYDNEASGWFTGETESCQASYLDGFYRTSTQPDFLCLYRAPTDAQPNGLFEVQVQRGATFYQTAYGLMFGEDGAFDHFYAYLVIPDTQNYALARFDATNGWFALTWDTADNDAWLHSDKIAPSTAMNHLAVERDGALITLFANGQLLDQLFDPAPLSTGYFGVINWSSQYDTAIADFDQFRLTSWEPGVNLLGAAGFNGPITPAPSKPLPVPELLAPPSQR